MAKTALLFYGGWDGHQPKALAQKFREDLSQANVEVTLVDSLDCLDDLDLLQQFDLIIPGWTMGTLSGDREKNLSSAVRAGVGLSGIHGTMGDSFRGAIDYEWMVGGHFVGHPHVGPYTVQIEDPEDPLTQGLPQEFSYDSEQYYLLTDPGIKVLLSTTYKYEGKEIKMPVAWTKNWGEGRVFYSSLGHSVEEFDENPAVWKMVLKGCLWAARK
ncbi:MAG: ThuA domain-containing protein [Verrucomicrobiota bacterium]